MGRDNQYSQYLDSKFVAPAKLCDHPTILINMISQQAYMFQQQKKDATENLWPVQQCQGVTQVKNHLSD